MVLTFLKREKTDGIRLDFRPEFSGMSHEDILKAVKKKGRLNLGYHYILRDNGMIESGIDTELYADYSLEDYKTSLYVLCVSDALTDAQRHNLDTLSHELKLPILTLEG